MTAATLAPAPADAVIDIFTGLDGRSLLPFVDLTDPDEVTLLVQLLRWRGPDV